MTTYFIRRVYYYGHPERTLATGLSLEEAQAHCRDRETSSRTCWEPQNVAHTEKYGPWMDTYDED